MGNRCCRALLACICYLFLSGAATAEIYKCRGKDGVIGFFDAPCAKGTISGSRYHLGRNYNQGRRAGRQRPQRYYSSYNTLSDYVSLDQEQVEKSPCLRSCVVRAKYCGLQCSQRYTNMGQARSCFLSCKSTSQGCVQSCQSRNYLGQR